MLRAATPALPVRDIEAAVAGYRDRFGFTAPHVEPGFAVLRRDEVEIHLWAAADDSWRGRAGKPVQSGAESFLAGTASCRIEVDDIDGLYRELEAAEVLHPVARAGVTATDFGTREFATLDADGNLLTFYRSS